MKEKFLPIGTVVKLNGGDKKAMILSYLIFPTGAQEIKDMYDYGGCAFPEGVLDSKTAIGFNHSDIAEIVHMGLEDDEDYKKLNDILKKNSDTLKREFAKTIFSKNKPAENAEKKPEEKPEEKAEGKE